MTEAKDLARPADFDFLHHIGDSYTTVRLYSAPFLAVLKLRAAPAAQDLLDAIEVIRDLYASNARKIPADAPTRFIKPRWKKLVVAEEASTGATTSCAPCRNSRTLCARGYLGAGLAPVQGF